MTNGYNYNTGDSGVAVNTLALHQWFPNYFVDESIVKSDVDKFTS